MLTDIIARSDLLVVVVEFPKSREVPTMRARRVIALMVLTASISACTSPTVTLGNRSTGQSASCEGQPLAPFTVKSPEQQDCIRRYEAQGYVPIQGPYRFGVGFTGGEGFERPQD
jgi:hypothetical protein